MNANVKIKVKDRIGLVNEISGIIQNLGITIVKHGADVSTDRNGNPVSSFRAVLSTDTPENFNTLKRKCEKVKGFISFSYSDVA